MFDPSQHVEFYSEYVRGGTSYDEDAADRGYRLPKVVFDELRPMLRKGWRILDVGCGSGLSAERFRSPYLELVGLDGSQELLALAREKQLYSHLAHVVIGKDQFPYVNHDFNISLALSVMAHFPLTYTLPALLQGATCSTGLIAFNYLDPDDFDGMEFTSDDAGGIVDKEDLNTGKVVPYYHRYDDIKATLDELCIHDHYVLESAAYMGVLGGGRTRIVIGQYMPKNS